MLDLEAELSAVQLVSPKTTKEEILSLYLEVYKQQRLPGSPPGELELMEEVVSSFEGHQGQKEGRTSGATARAQSNEAQPSKSGVPGKREISIEQSLATVRGPPKGTGCSCCPQGRDRKAEPSPLPEVAGH